MGIAPAKGEWVDTGKLDIHPRIAASTATPVTEIIQKEKKVALGRILVEELGEFGAGVLLNYFGFNGHNPMKRIRKDFNLTNVEIQSILTRAKIKLAKRPELHELLTAK
ncbi:Uncharacterised protein [uncultured archaeon]|nr:Uncharacterised protein [uncultured archaeon]